MSRRTPHEVDPKPYSRHNARLPSPDRHGQPLGHPCEAYGNSSQNRSRYGDDHQPYQTQTQMQGQLQRSVEASKQMLYGIFGNVLAILEEYEQREIRGITESRATRSQSIRRSNLPLPDQSHKTREDLASIVETQLLLFETQSNNCPPEVKASLREELKRKTLGWAAVRSDMKLPENQNTDRYIAKLYEILSTGRTDHKVPSRKGLNEDVMRSGFQAILHGNHDREMLDQSFRNNPNKKAKAPDTRHSEMYDEAARRISNARGTHDLDHHLQSDVRRFHGYGPGDLK